MTEHAPIRRAILWAKLALATFEILGGVLLLVARFGHVDLVHVIGTLAAHELRQDPGDFVARRANVVARDVGPRAGVIGAVLVAYGVLKGGLIVGVLRRYRTFVFVGAAIFVVIALSGFVVLVTHPTALRVLLGFLDIAVAAVVTLEARDLSRKTRS